MESLPDFVRLAEAYGHVGIAIQHPAELEEKLQLALDTLAKGRLVFVDVTVDGSEHVYPMQGLPAALGVKMALPEETVICVTGDGSIQMNIQELSTALQYDLPVLVLNLNNRFLGMVKQWQDMIYSGRKCLEFDRSSDKIKPQAVIETIARLTGGEAYVTSDVGQHQMFAALYYPFDKPRRWINSGGLGTMGFDCPNATIMHIDVDPTSISKTVSADIPIVGDAKQTLVQMLELLAQSDTQQQHDSLRDWWQNIETWRSKLAEQLNIPVTTSLMGLGAFPGTHRQCVGMLGMHGTYEANMTMHNADLIFGIGVRFDDRTTNNLAKAKDILNPANKLPYAWPESVSMRSYNPTLQGHKGQIKRALQTLLAAHKPVIYAGGGAITSGCEAELRVVILSGQVPSSLIGYDAFQECDMVGISRPVVKHSFLVKSTEEIPTVLKKAFWLAASGRPGPVVIDLVLDIYDALQTVGGIDHVLVRHEQGAVHMADGLARATGEVGVVLVTSGPGATNAITGIATAYMDSIPRA
ncbi:hypothetical protein CRX72_08285 [Pantoea sp. BRM17]|nr:hypothetical protein CRX72_08285 [Pantoea sp. BRM17]